MKKRMTREEIRAKGEELQDSVRGKPMSAYQYYEIDRVDLPAAISQERDLVDTPIEFYEIVGEEVRGLVLVQSTLDDVLMIHLVTEEGGPDAGSYGWIEFRNLDPTYDPDSQDRNKKFQDKLADLWVEICGKHCK